MWEHHKITEVNVLQFIFHFQPYSIVVRIPKNPATQKRQKNPETFILIWLAIGEKREERGVSHRVVSLDVSDHAYLIRICSSG